MTSVTVKQFTDMRVGLTTSYSAVLDAKTIAAYAALSGDHNPIHEDADYASGTRFGRPVAHGLLVASFVQSALTKLVAPGGVSVRYEIDLIAPAFVDAKVTAHVNCTALDSDRSRATFGVTVVDDTTRTTLIRGTAVVAFPRGDQ